MALGRRNNRDSYGVPVRSAPAVQPMPAMAAAATAAPAGAPPAPPAPDFFSPAPVAPPSYQGPPPPYSAGGAQTGYPPYGGGYQSPPMPPAVPRSTKRPFVRIGGAVVAVLIAVAAFAAFRNNSPITVPATLGGQPRMTGPQIDPVLEMTKAGLEKQNPGRTVETAAYGVPGQAPLVLAVMRGRLDVERDMNQVAATSRQQFGSVTCAKLGGAVGCEWSGSVSGGVFGTKISMADLAVIAQEAKNATD
jgi:hypothetical protein